ncbi:MAG: three-Cys-motif partner protein TcmP [Alcaligenaceae bacterium]|nr:three-Cys-motif partner protein TcmP [Alcaligenaceae bacterium]
MSINQYDWAGNSAILLPHSIVKHNIIEDYLKIYFEISSRNPNQERLNLTLIDGFAGGGLYTHKETNNEALGSPFILLEAVAEAQIKIDLYRKSNNMKRLILDVNFIFVDKSREAIKQLEANLRLRGYSERINKSIFLVCDFFHQQSQKIIGLVKKRTPQSGRSIFILDQYGYKDVPRSVINNIFYSLPKAEIILTFNIDSILNFISKSKDLNVSISKLLKKTEFIVPPTLADLTLKDIKNNEYNWRFFLQSVLYQGITSQCNAKYYTPFFIKNPKGHGAYWLIHMSQHPTARDAMTEVHWTKSNNYCHYGGSGIDMYNIQGFDPRLDEYYNNQRSFNFTDNDKQESQSILMEQLPKFICDELDGKEIPFEDLYEKLCNTTPATQTIIKNALLTLINYKEIEVTSSSGSKRRSQITPSDIIKFPSQSTIFLMGQ